VLTQQPDGQVGRDEDKGKAKCAPSGINAPKVNGELDKEITGGDYQYVKAH